MRPLVNTRVPAKLSYELLHALGGPPDPVLVKDHRYVSVSACVAHACGVKGFFWIDVKTGVGLGAVALTTFDHLEADSLRLGSNGLSPTRIPAAARDALIDWLSEKELTPEHVDFIGSQGESLSLDASAFKPHVRYEPAGGPSFDCARASGVVARNV